MEIICSKPQVQTHVLTKDFCLSVKCPECDHCSVTTYQNDFVLRRYPVEVFRGTISWCLNYCGSTKAHKHLHTHIHAEANVAEIIIVDSSEQCLGNSFGLFLQLAVTWKISKIKCCGIQESVREKWVTQLKNNKTKLSHWKKEYCESHNRSTGTHKAVFACYVGVSWFTLRTVCA